MTQEIKKGQKIFDVINQTRRFHCFCIDGIKNDYGNYVTDTPKQAASKIYTKLTKTLKMNDEPVPDKCIIYLQETTPNSNNNIYGYESKRLKLAKPQELTVVDKNSGEEKTIIFEYRNLIHKIPVSNCIYTHIEAKMPYYDNDLLTETITPTETFRVNSEKKMEDHNIAPTETFQVNSEEKMEDHNIAPTETFQVNINETNCESNHNESQSLSITDEEPKKDTINESYEQNDIIDKKRFFKLVDPITRKCSGRYSGNTPKQAASKAYTKIIQTNRINGTFIPETSTIDLQESTRGSSRKIYSYQVSREKLVEPRELKIQCKNTGEEKTIVYTHRNRVCKVQSVNNTENS